MEMSDLYQISFLREEGGINHYKVLLNPGHEVFEGHFPGVPVMPGVCMLQLVKDCIADKLGETVRFSYLKSCKFVSVVNPQQHRELEVSFTLSDDKGLQATVSANGTVALKLKGLRIEN